jgi:hypothetical protein
MKRRFISTILIITALITVLPTKTILASAINYTIIPYVEDHDVDSVNIVDLAKAMHVEVKKVDGGIEMFLNNKTIKIYDNDATIHINGLSVPLKILEYKDPENSDKTIKMPMAQKPTKSGDGYLIPKTIIEENIGIKCDSDGIHIDSSTIESGGATSEEELFYLNSHVQTNIKVTNPISKDAGITRVDYKITNFGETINVEELANAIGEQVTKTADGIEVYLNGRKVNIKNTGELYIDNTLVYQTATKLSGMYVLTKEVVDGKLGIPAMLNYIEIRRSAYLDSHLKVIAISNQKSTYDTSSISNNSNEKNTITAQAVNADEYTPIYDYDLVDYEDAYIDKHNISRITYDANLANMLEQQMEADRLANISKGWHTKDGKFYFLEKGVPITGWYKDGITWYYFNSDGSMKTGWLYDKGNWYYFYDSGAMAQKVLVNGYYLNENGAWSNDVPANASTGIAYKELINRVRNLGFSHKTKFEADDPYNNSGAALYDFEYYSKSAARSICSLEIRDNYTLSISADYESDDPKYNKSVYQVLQWLLPTQIQEVYNKINANPVPQTIYADGRIVKVSFYQFGIQFNISDQ